jgi:PPOX class probable F420-dependent enzyme
MAELSAPMREFLDGVHFAVAATIASDGMPHQTVIWYALDADELVFNIPKGSLKHKHLQRDPRVSLCVEDGYRYVTLTGTVTMVEDPQIARSDYMRLGARYQGTFTARPSTPPSGRNAELLSRERVALRMKIERVQTNGLG